MGSINHNLKAIYIHNPKCGGLYITKILETFYDFIPVATNNLALDHKEINKIYETIRLDTETLLKTNGVVEHITTNCNSESQEIWNTYYKFTFVRNPYTKLISAFKYCNHSMKLYRKYKNINDTSSNTDETFNSFWNNLEEDEEDEEDEEYDEDDNEPLSLVEFMINLFNPEFKEKGILFHSLYTQTKHLEYSKTKYDFVGRFENLDEDLIKVLIELKLPIKHQRFLINDIEINNSNKRLVFDININEEILDRINKTFYEDFHNFNYELIETIKDDIFKEKNDRKERKKSLVDKLIKDKLIESPFESVFINNIEVLRLKEIYEKKPMDVVNPLDEYEIIVRNNTITDAITDLFKSISFSSFGK